MNKPETKYHNLGEESLLITTLPDGSKIVSLWNPSKGPDTAWHGMLYKATKK